MQKRRNVWFGHHFHSKTVPLTDEYTNQSESNPDSYESYHKIRATPYSVASMIAAYLDCQIELVRSTRTKFNLQRRVLYYRKLKRTLPDY